MDDYNVNVLSEARNEYSSRLVTILTPLMIEGIKSIFEEAYTLCLDNEENEKYLMTFQNFLSRVPKWNSTIIEEETERIVKTSQCSYLEDLLTCVHITQLKILTSIRVSQKQKKIDIEIPKLYEFIHKCYISYARKLYSNVYLFEKNILPLAMQKNMREAELMCQECILQVIRDNMPVESILRAYMDETVDEEIIEETIEKIPTPEELIKIEKEKKEKESKIIKTENTLNVEKPELEKADISKELNVNKEETSQKDKEVTEELSKNENGLKLQIDTNKLLKDDSDVSNILKENDKKKDIEKPKSSLLTFNNNDSVLDMGTNKEAIINAPKTLKRLEEISKVQNEKRKAEEAEEDDEDSIKIFDNAILSLDTLDIHDLNKGLNLNPPVLEGIEVLS